MSKHHLQGYLSTSKVEEDYKRGKPYTKTLLTAFRTGYKRVSLFITRVTYATGEVSKDRDSFNIYIDRDGRGSIVPTTNNHTNN